MGHGQGLNVIGTANSDQSLDQTCGETANLACTGECPSCDERTDRLGPAPLGAKTGPSTLSKGDRAVAWMRIAAALEDQPEPNRRLRRAAARTTKGKGRPTRRK